MKAVLHLVLLLLFPLAGGALARDPAGPAQSALPLKMEPEAEAPEQMTGLITPELLFKGVDGLEVKMGGLPVPVVSLETRRMVAQQLPLALPAQVVPLSPFYAVSTSHTLKLNDLRVCFPVALSVEQVLGGVMIYTLHQGIFIRHRATRNDVPGWSWSHAAHLDLQENRLCAVYGQDQSLRLQGNQIQVFVLVWSP